MDLKVYLSYESSTELNFLLCYDEAHCKERIAAKLVYFLLDIIKKEKS
jgi:hypothetical protein